MSSSLCILDDFCRLAIITPIFHAFETVTTILPIWSFDSSQDRSYPVQFKCFVCIFESIAPVSGP
jgi:hypothetical protein